MLYKYASILSRLNSTLSSEIWNTDLSINQSVREKILHTLYACIPKNFVKRVDIIGSMTGHQWDEGSDIDINVAVPDEYVLEYKRKRKAINGTLLIGEHPVNYYVTPYQEREDFWHDSKFGVYNILENKWEIPPPEHDLPRPPEEQFSLEIAFAKMKRKQLQLLLNEFRKDMLALSVSENTENLNRCAESYQDVLNFIHTLDQNRKLQYSKGWGVPRESQDNITFKFLEHSPIGQFVEDLKNNG